MRTRTLAAYLSGLTATIAAILLACNQGSVGDRCNPDLSHDECNSGLTCTQPPLCPETYCCPVDSNGNLESSSDPNCQTGCNGGAASMCNASLRGGAGDDGGECAFACANDPSDLSSTSVCAEDGGTPVGDAGDAADARGEVDAGADADGIDAAIGADASSDAGLDAATD
jgi:hypothetical protein